MTESGFIRGYSGVQEEILKLRDLLEKTVN